MLLILEGFEGFVNVCWTMLEYEIIPLWIISFSTKKECVISSDSLKIFGALSIPVFAAQLYDLGTSETVLDWTLTVDWTLIAGSSHIDKLVSDCVCWFDFGSVCDCVGLG